MHLVGVWDSMKQYDLPNWFVVVVWPVALFLWGQRKVPYISNFEVSLSRETTKVGEQKRYALCLNFLNNTGSVIYLMNARILNCSRFFHVDSEASRDIANSSYELKFATSANGPLTARQIIIQTNEQPGTCLLLAHEASDEMLSYRPNAFRQFFRMPKYFQLDYIAMVGNKRLRVSTVY